MPLPYAWGNLAKNYEKGVDKGLFILLSLLSLSTAIRASIHTNASNLFQKAADLRLPHKAAVCLRLDLLEGRRRLQIT